MRAILDHISRGFEVLFVEDDPEQFPLWQKTIGARRFGASGHVDTSLRKALLAAGSWAATRVLGHGEDADLKPDTGARGSAADGRAVALRRGR